MKTRTYLLALSLAVSPGLAGEAGKPGVTDGCDAEAFVHHPSGDKTAYSPYAGREYPTTVYFGDAHHHTSPPGRAATLRGATGIASRLHAH